MPTIKIVPMPGVSVPGPQGPRGLQGLQGETGLTGPIGPTGASAYEIAVDNGFEGTEQEWLDSLSGSGSSADIADFTFTNESDYDPETFEGGTSEISLHNKDFTIRTTRDELTEEQIDEFGNIDADINLRAADDIFITAEGDDVNISATNDVVINSNDLAGSNTWEFSSDGHFYLPNGTDILDASETFDIPVTYQLVATTDYLGNSPTGNANGIALELTADADWIVANFNTNTSSTITFGDNTIENITTAYTYDFSGTVAAVFQWDTSRDVVWPVTIDQTSNISNNTKSLTLNVPDNIQISSWEFSSDGTLNLSRSGIITNTNGDIILDADDNVYVGNSDTPDNQVATLGDIQAGITNAEPVDTVFAVNGGTLGTQPTFSGDPMFYGSYLRFGDQVAFRVDVDMDNIISFGDGQYYIDLPVASKYNMLMRGGCLHDISTGNQWPISGHVNAGETRMTLWFTSGTGQDEIFDHNSPVNLSTADNFHVSGTYIV